MHQAILITQCLQNDFVQPLRREEPLPNLLHVGHDEARRLMGENPAEGPVARVMEWVYRRPAGELAIVHIRDWHAAGDPAQESHLQHFGAHCLAGTEGARFAFADLDPGRPLAVINSPGLSDFEGTPLAEVLAPFGAGTVRVGLAGVWTEAKITFLAYDLRTRYPHFEIGVCSALTASSSRAHHFLALEQLQRLLGVKVFSSVGEFTQFLGGTAVEVPLPAPSHADRPEVLLDEGATLDQTDCKLVRYLFRDCRSVKLRPLGGGFSGNVVMGSESEDLHGHRQAPHVVKIGPQALIGKERTAFEQVDGVLGNSAPRIAEFADLAGRGALKYRYAAMGGGFSTTFRKLYCAGLSRERTEGYLQEVFAEQLGRLYAAAISERCNLLEYYAFSPSVAPHVRASVEKILGAPAEGPMLRLPDGPEIPNLCLFYEESLARLLPRAVGSARFAFVHGDLNGANIVVDAHDNTWLIDFFHTHRGHVLRDLIKLENDLLFIFTPVCDAGGLAEGLRLADALLEVEDITAPLPDAPGTGLKDREMVRAWETVRVLRSFYGELVRDDADPVQVLIARLRYAAHTMSFDESNEWQKRWALYTSAHCARRIEERLAPTDCDLGAATRGAGRSIRA